jgi:hypothetical protein
MPCNNCCEKDKNGDFIESLAVTIGGNVLPLIQKVLFQCVFTVAQKCNKNLRQEFGDITLKWICR